MGNSLLLCALLALCLYLQPSTSLANETAYLKGRFDASPKGQFRFGWPGSEIQYRFRGTSLSVEIIDSGRNFIVVSVDGLTRKEKLKSGRHKYVLGEHLPISDHTISIIRVTEGNLGSTTVLNAVTDGIFLAPLKDKRKMLVIGDSISNGYGIEGKNNQCDYSPATQNQYLSYTAVAARMLGADLTTIAVSGIGLTGTYDKREQTILHIWRRTIPTERHIYDTPSPPPEVIVLHLGTNDFSNKSSRNIEKFEFEYLNFLKELNNSYPNAHIYPAIGPMLADSDYQQVSSSIKKSIFEYNKDQLEKNKIKLIEFRGNKYAGVGCNWHPNISAHKNMAATLIEEIKKNSPWGK